MVGNIPVCCPVTKEDMAFILSDANKADYPQALLKEKSLSLPFCIWLKYAATQSNVDTDSSILSETVDLQTCNESPLADTINTDLDD